MSSPFKSFSSHGWRQSGFGLVEIMVGVLIGMIGMLVMMQIFANSETTKRSTTGGDDAQTNGAVTLFNLQREIRQSGYGINSTNLLGCNVQLRSGVTLNKIAPATINHDDIPAGDANTDTLLVVYGNTDGAPEGDVIVLPPSGGKYTVATPSSFKDNDLVIAQYPARPSPCNLSATNVTKVETTGVTVASTVAGTTNGTLFNLGGQPRIVAYAVRNGKLTQCDYVTSNCSAAGSVSDSTVWVPVADNVVSLRAEYGKDTDGPPMDAVLNSFDHITPGSATDTSGFSLQCGYARISALRLALVTRNAQYDKDAVTTESPTWQGDTAIDLSASTGTTGDWQHYRYKVFQTVIPLRNVINSGVRTGC